MDSLHFIKLTKIHPIHYMYCKNDKEKIHRLEDFIQLGPIIYIQISNMWKNFRR